MRVPVAIRSILGRQEIRLSLATADAAVARRRVRAVLPSVLALTGLRHCMTTLTEEQRKRAVEFAYARIVEQVKLSAEPWERPAPDSFDASPGLNEATIMRAALGVNPIAITPDSQFEPRTRVLSQAIVRGDHTPAVPVASSLLARMQMPVSEDSPEFRTLCFELLKMIVRLRVVLDARSRGDYSLDRELCAAPGVQELLVGSGAGASTSEQQPTIEEAWAEYYAERTAARPRPMWSAKTARGQAAMYSELREIVGNILVREITRKVMLSYRDAIARLPANRHKRYPGKSIAELLEQEIPAAHLPADRTVAEKLVQMGAFMKWCRETKQFLAVDPLVGVQVAVRSESYSVFSNADLNALFHSREYLEGRHRTSWQYWIPLIALYSGARQAEIAQLLTADLVEDDGVWYFAITDAEGDKRIKTRAGVRKVPISSKLLELGLTDYVEHLRSQGITRLFPDLRKGAYGWGHKVSRWFNDVYKKNCGIVSDATGRRKVFHSFRHTAITKSLGAGQPLAHCQQVFGHEQSLLGETATYMSEFPIATLVPVIESLDFGLNHTDYSAAWRTLVD
jgi:integrase